MLFVKIAIVGVGYVGLSLAVLLSQYNQVVALDVVSEKVDMINRRESPIRDSYIEKYFKEKNLNLKATLNPYEAFIDASFIIICTPTNFSENINTFDTSSIIETIEKIMNMELDTTIVIKSTVPIGFTEKIKEMYGINNIFFSPEFLREGKALYDNLYPARIIIGDNSNKAISFASLLSNASLKNDIPIKYMNSSEAEAVKLFSNTFLALRVDFFNELDTYAEANGLRAKDIIDGVCLDPRIGHYYNNPSFGYGGYCLPKDTKQLLSSFASLPHNIIEAVVTSNESRKRYIANMIMNCSPKTVGVYRLIMKSSSDNYRECAVGDIIKILKKKEVNILIYEPGIVGDEFASCRIENNINKFKKTSDIIIANRMDDELLDVVSKVYTRDIYQTN